MSEPIKVNVEVTPALHPENIRTVEGYDENTAGYVKCAEEAFSHAYETIGRMHLARQAVIETPDWNESKKILKLVELHDKHLVPTLKKFQDASDNLSKGIAHLQNSLSEPLQQKAGLGTVNQEIRNHVKSMDHEDRRKFVIKAITANDVTTLTATLGAPAYLSGLSDVEHQHFTNLFNEQQQPVVAKRLRVMIKARDITQARAPLVFGELKKAVGNIQWHKVERLKKAKNKSQQALLLATGSAE